MKTPTPAGGTSANKPRIEKITGPEGKSREVLPYVTIELDRKDLSERAKRLILSKSEEWRCTEGEAASRLLDEGLAKHPAASAPHSSVTINVDRELYQEVGELLESPEGISIFGEADMEARLSAHANTWLRNVSFAFYQGSGYRSAAGLEGSEKGVRL